jgi:hypothetical protein
MQVLQMFTTSFTASASTPAIDFLNEDPASDNNNGLDNICHFSPSLPLPGRSQS